MFNFHTERVLSFILAILCVFQYSRSMSYPHEVCCNSTNYITAKCVYSGNALYTLFETLKGFNRQQPKTRKLFNCFLQRKIVYLQSRHMNFES